MAAILGNGKPWISNVVFFFFFLAVHMNAGLDTINKATTNYGEVGTSSQKLEVDKLLKKLNKPAVKSIKVYGDRIHLHVFHPQSPDGDIIDCVSVLNQPAFDHPKLKNHKLKMRPTFRPEAKIESKTSSKSKPIMQPWHQIGSCPNGTIPIRRTRKEDILRASSIQQFGKKNVKTVPPRSYVAGQGGHEYASVFVKGEKYYGGKATMSVWQPTVQKDEYSISQIWVISDADSKNLNTIEAGWQVHPQLYGDNATRLFTYWTSDSYKSTGCYDLVCSGFVQLDAGIAVGSRITPLSVYGDANSQYDISIMIWKDVSNGDWWMQYGEDKVMGYWPSSLFTHLSDSSTAMQLGGEVVNSESEGQHSTTQMGSGHFPSEGHGKAGYFINIKYVNGQNQLVPAGNLVPYVDHPNCYDLRTDHNDDWGNFFFYGGPGRNPNCP